MHFPKALLLKLAVANCENLVDDQDLRVEMRGNRERKPNIHTAAISLHGHINEPLDAGKIDDFIEVSIDLATGHTKNRAIDKDIFPSGEFRMKSGSHFQETGNPPLDADATGGGFGDPAKNF